MIRFSSLGDILLTAPALRAVKRRFPESMVDILVASEYEDAARLIPGVDRVITFDRSTGLRGLFRLRRQLAGQYNLLVDLQNSVRSAYLRATTFPTIWVKAQRYRLRRWMLIHFKRNLYHGVRPVSLRYLDALDLVGGHDDGDGLGLVVPAQMKDWATDYLSAHCDLSRGIVALCPGARHNTKRWPVDRWIELGNGLVPAGMHVLLIGSETESGLIREIGEQVPGAAVIVDRSITEVAAIFTQCAAAVSNDSGLMHLAYGVGIPVVAIFGPTVEEFGFYPFRAESMVLDHPLYCRPCTAIGGKRCPEGHFRCMLETSPPAVLASVRKLLGSDEAMSS